ncbi:neuronal acetylcholine receptor subunit beta-3-like [Megalobrama amblycephala]|uniref:neuronal acetylcholine receptor subunit beta-3-like n=1 Tax=Megalobrama amblycephala TaxID=75352 RepID=UPI002013FD9A|nr:neuronal acetylcholine receptor subunit beta-3-like [Megalobrama amblycephala]
MWPLMYNYIQNSYYGNRPANIYVDLFVTSIINVNEKAQSLSTLVKMITVWPNLNMKWNTSNFCGISTFYAFKNMFWTPDIGIIESSHPKGLRTLHFLPEDEGRGICRPPKMVKENYPTRMDPTPPTAKNCKRKYIPTSGESCSS